jgi:hypothetical protein
MESGKMGSKLKIGICTLFALAWIAVAAIPPAWIDYGSWLASDQLLKIERVVWFTCRMLELSGKMVWSG